MATRLSTARHPLHLGHPLSANLLRLPSSAPADEPLLLELDRMGYHGRFLAKHEERLTFLDTPDGALFQKGVSLVESKPRGVRYLAFRETSPRAPLQGKEASTVRRMLAHAPPSIPQLYCDLHEKRYRLGNISGPAIRLSLFSLRLRDPLDRAPEGSLRLVSLGGEGAWAAVDRDYFALLLRERLGCKALGTSILEAGLSILGLPLPGASLPREYQVGRDDTLALAGHKVIAGQLYKLQANLPGALRDLDPEYVHALRVASRRLRYGLRLFSPLFDPELLRRLRATLTAAARLSGGLRDTDLLLSRLPSQLRRIRASPPLQEGLLGHYSRRRAAMLARLREELSSERLSEILHSLPRPGAGEGAEPAPPRKEGDASSPGGTPLPGSPIEPFARLRIRRAFRKLSTWLKRPTDQLSDEDLHRIRILCRRLRYTLEFFLALGGRRVAHIIESCTAIQDCLGTYHDAAVARESLSALSNEPLFSAPELVAQIGALVALQERVRRAEFERFLRLWSDFGTLARRGGL